MDPLNSTSVLIGSNFYILTHFYLFALLISMRNVLCLSLKYEYLSFTSYLCHFLCVLVHIGLELLYLPGKELVFTS